jgi:hypothetical protein
VFFSTTGLLGLVFAGFVALILVLRIVRRARRRRFNPPMDLDFSMVELNDMRAKGLVTAEEFERLKQTVLARSEARETMRLEALAQKRPAGALGFQVIQNPPPIPPDDSSRDAR